jgi:transposase
MKTLDEVEREYIFQVLEQCEWCRTKAANILGVSFKTIVNKIIKWKKEGYNIPDNQKARNKKKVKPNFKYESSIVKPKRKNTVIVSDQEKVYRPNHVYQYQCVICKEFKITKEKTDKPYVCQDGCQNRAKQIQRMKQLGLY